MIEDVTVGQYSKVNIRDLQMKSLEILLYFKDFCEKHNLRFYLCYGSCLGAIRHCGFIPWDDDIDVLMFREDYEKLGELWNKYADTERYEYCRTNKDKSYETMLTQIADNNTTFIKSNLADFDINHGIKLEIFPLDASPNSKLKRKMQIIWALAFCLFNRQQAPLNKGKIARVIGQILLWFFRTPGIRYKIWRFAEKQMTKYPLTDDTKYLTKLCTTFKYLKIQYPKEIFDGVVYKEFEGYKMPVPVGYDMYLKLIYGDYMQLPPESERIPAHEAAFVDPDNSYRKYRGIYYCTKNRSNS